MKTIGVSLALCVLLGSSPLAGLAQSSHSNAAAQKHGAVAADFEPKPIQDNVWKGVTYLVHQQNEDGSWSQGEESKYMQSMGQRNGDIHNVADTCMAALALVRVGNLPDSGVYRTNVAKAADYVCKSIENSDADSLFITPTRGTRVQVKLGQYIDTFLAAVFLPEVANHMGSSAENKRVAAALQKVVHKIEKNQGSDGTFANGGWAPIHSQSLALQGLNKASRVGIKVADETLKRAQSNNLATLQGATNGSIGAGSAGVPLYTVGAALGGMQSTLDNYKAEKSSLLKMAASPVAKPAEAQIASAKLQMYADSERAQNEAIQASTARFKDKGFISGFGCNGGEEFLSYLQISQTLLANKSDEWPDWNKNITANIDHVQNADGSWIGQHCITSRTFCTSAAVLVLTADRANSSRTIASAIHR